MYCKGTIYKNDHYQFIEIFGTYVKIFPKFFNVIYVYLIKLTM